MYISENGRRSETQTFICSLGCPTASIIITVCSGLISIKFLNFRSFQPVELQLRQHVDRPIEWNAITSDIENIPPSIACWYLSPETSKAFKSEVTISKQGIFWPKPLLPFWYLRAFSINKESEIWYICEDWRLQTEGVFWARLIALQTWLLSTASSEKSLTEDLEKKKFLDF